MCWAYRHFDTANAPGEIALRHPAGSPLTAQVYCVATCAPVLSYQWQIQAAPGSASYINIGTDSATYTPTKDDQKRKIRVEITKP